MTRWYSAYIQKIFITLTTMTLQVSRKKLMSVMKKSMSTMWTDWCSHQKHSQLVQPTRIKLLIIRSVNLVEHGTVYSNGNHPMKIRLTC